ncbi:ribonuclease E/G [Terasakiella sp. A23]|uniref:Rne/Rng family ribonuclease n=1 Tax=Terasakiella sp. FCG-A23 TaxID=3080561 RepID=UPI0029558880|nr:ribonuclease E/G [Terasakiella sp. A23]MDV7339412.1 ribonuclease E/G [Terasakiella sp. A23]
MATKRMLIDATHPEETRVVVVDGNRLDELEFESAARRQLKGNIYLAKVTRVEPSLQAAFVEYGGNRHGFLAFNEIHPDYYQIPVSDREEFEADVEDDGDDAEPKEGAVEESGSDDSDQVEHIRPHYRNQRRYKIQEVIKKRQIILVQVVKEERGNKGAALTTYLSLAGRYCVLMPNTDKGGGISRKIANVKDRKRLKSVLSELSIPKGTAVIVRTAGAERSKAEIKRDFEYLMRLWSNIRDVTLQSQAPALIYEEANLIKRSIRDMYSRDIDEVLVEGEEGYRTAKDFMKMLIPSHAKKVQPYRDETQIPLFHRYQVEGQLDAMHSAIVQLPSGGYIVINPTEALVAIDVNSGRSTKERNIEETALKTNLEAADEIARSLRLRDLAGLVVVDFIDMEISRNQSAVERRMKDAMKNDRARIQIGRISPFGLLEMSRQRLRPSFTETSTETCPHCHGTGVRRSLESTVLHVLRVIEEEGIRRRSDEIIVNVPTQVALYILNQKREQLASIEERYQMQVQLSGDDSLVSPEYKLERLKAKKADDTNTVRPLGPEDSTKLEDIKDEVLDNSDGDDEQENDGRKRRRRRRGRRNKKDIQTDENAVEVVENEDGTSDDDDDDDKPRKRRRRGKRGGRRRTRRNPEDEAQIEGTDEQSGEEAETESPSESAETTETDEEAKPKRRPRRRGMRRRRPDTDEAAAEATSEAESVSEEPSATEDAPVAEEAEEKPKKPRTRRRKKADDEADAEKADTSEKATDAASGEKSEEEKPKKPRTRRRKKADDDEAKAEEVKSEDKPTEEEKPKKRAPRKLAAKKEEPKVEEKPAEPKVEATVIATTAVTVKSSEGVHEEVTEDKPKRKGWWSR